MSNISFTANLIKRTQVQKSENYRDYYPSDVSIVELDKDDEEDVKSLYQTAVLWNYQGAKYASDIFHEAIKGYEYDDVDREHYFALTTQTKDFENLCPDKVLGLMLFSQTNNAEDEINWFQVRPNTNTKQTWKREYKKIGEAMVNLLKGIYFEKPIHVQSVPESVGFYKKMEFQNRDDDGTCSLYLEV